MAGSSSFDPRHFSLKQLAWFVGAVFVATVIANTLLNRLPVSISGPLTSASRGF